MRRTGRKMTGGSTGARRKSGTGRRTVRKTVRRAVRRRTQAGRRTGGWVEEEDRRRGTGVGWRRWIGDRIEEGQGVW